MNSLDWNEHETLLALRQVYRDTGKPASAQAVAGRSQLSIWQARRLLRSLCSKGFAAKAGRRQGWLPASAARELLHRDPSS